MGHVHQNHNNQKEKDDFSRTIDYVTNDWVPVNQVSVLAEDNGERYDVVDSPQPIELKGQEIILETREKKGRRNKMSKLTKTKLPDHPYPEVEETNSEKNMVMAMDESNQSHAPKPSRSQMKISPPMTRRRAMQQLKSLEGQPHIDPVSLSGSKRKTARYLDSSIIAEVEVPPSGYIYEGGDVWEEFPPPSIKTDGKGILKQVSGVKRKRFETPNDAEVSEGVDVLQPHYLHSSPAAKRNNESKISFCEEPPHVRYYFSPTLARKRKPNRAKGKTKSRIAEAAIELNQSSIEVTPKIQNGNASWNPENAKLKTQDFNETFTISDMEDHVENENSAKTSPENLILPTPLPADHPFKFDFDSKLPTSSLLNDNELMKVKIVPEMFQMNLKFGGVKPHLINTSGFNELEGNNSQGFELIVDVEKNDSDSIFEVEVETSTSALPNTEDIIGGPLSEPLLFVNSETGIYNLNPIYPELFSCEDPIQSIVNNLTHPTAQRALVEIFIHAGINTVGDLSRQSELEIIKWPIIAPKYETTFDVLREYHERMKLPVVNETMDDLLQKPILFKEQNVSSPSNTAIALNLNVNQLQLESGVSNPRTEERTPHRLSPLTADTAAEASVPIASANHAGVAVPHGRGVRNVTMPEVVQSYNAFVPFGYDNLLVLGQFLEFLESDDVSALELMHTIAARDKIAQDILKILIQRSDFQQRFWKVTHSHFFRKPPMTLCDFIMTEEAKALFEETYGKKIEGRLAQNFWRNILTALHKNFVECLNPNLDKGKRIGEGKLEDNTEFGERLEAQTVLNFIQYTLNKPIEHIHLDEVEVAQRPSLKEENESLDEIQEPTVATPSASVLIPVDIDLYQQEKIRKAMSHVAGMTEESVGQLIMLLFKNRPS